MLADRIRMSSYKSKKLIDRTTPTVVVNQPYSREGNGGRKLIRLDNGALVCGVYDKVGQYIYLYKSLDSGNTWSLLVRATNNSHKISDFALGGKDNFIYLLFLIPTLVFVRVYDINIVNDQNGIHGGGYNIGGGHTELGKCSLEINPEGTELHACWSSKTSTYPNSFNIRDCKGIISDNGSVTWGSVEQVNVENNTNNNSLMPTIDVVNNLPIIIYHYSIGAWHYIMCMEKSTGSFTRRTVFNPGSGYLQSSPSSCVDKDGVIPVVWHGTDSMHPSTNYIRFSKSLDNGVVWSTMKKIVPGTNPSLTTDKNGTYYIEYQDGNYVKRIQSSDKGESWSSPIILDVSSNPSTLYDNKFELDFEVPLSIRQNSNSVIFSGKWYEE